MTVDISHFVVVIYLLMDVRIGIVLRGDGLLPFKLRTPETMDNFPHSALESPTNTDFLGSELRRLSKDIELDLLHTLHMLVVLFDHDKIGILFVVLILQHVGMFLFRIVALVEVEQEDLAIQIEVREVLRVVLLSIDEHVLVMRYFETVRSID